MATTDNISNIMPGTLLQDEYEISLNCHDEEDEEDELAKSSCTHFSLLLKQSNRCSAVSAVTNPAFFSDVDFDDLSIESSVDVTSPAFFSNGDFDDLSSDESSVESYCIEEIIEDDNSISTQTEIETDMDAKTPVVPLATETIQREERQWKPLMARYAALRERRRGGKRATRCATSSTPTKVRKLLSPTKVGKLLSPTKMRRLLSLAE